MAKKHIKGVEERIREYLDKHETCNISEIAKATGLRHGTVSDIIKNMEQKGEVIITNIATAKMIRKVQL